MIHSLFPHRRSSLREARLLGRNFDAAPEVQKAKELMQNPRAKLAELQDVITKGLQTQKESGEFIDTLARELNRENNEEVLRNLDELTKDTTDTSLGALRSTIHQLKERMNTVPPSAQQPVNTVEETPAEQPSFLNRVGTGIGNTAETISNTVLPKSWNEHMTRNQKIAAGAALTLGAGVVLWQLGKMLFGRGKNAAEAGKEAAANTKGGFFKKLLIGGLVLGGVFFGAKALFKNMDTQSGTANGSSKKRNGLMDYLWKNLVPDEAKPYLEAGQNTLSTALKTAEVVTPIATGAGAHVLNRGKEWAEDNAEIVLNGMNELGKSQSGIETAEILARNGWSLLWLNGSWIIDNGVETLAVPASFYKRLFITQDIETNKEALLLYGEAGAAYVLGRTTINSILTGKLPVPASFTKLGLFKSAASTVMQSVFHPFLFLYDGAQVSRVLLTEEGRTVLNGQLLRSGYVGAGREYFLRFHTVDDFVRSAQYFQDQQAFLTALEKSKHADPRVVKDVQISVLNIADKIAKNAQKMNFSDAPEWLTKLKGAIANQKSGEDLRRTVSEITATIPKGAVKAAEAAKATANAADVVDTAVKAEKAAETVAEGTRLFDRVVEAIAAARKLGDSEQIMKLLQSPIIQTMAKQGNRMAQSLQHVWRLVAPGMKWAGRVVIVIGPLIDAALIVANRYELADARKTGNQELIKTLESKQTALVGGGVANLGVLALSAPAAAVALPLTVGTTLYVNAVYDSIATWQKSPEDWFAYSAKDLRTKLDERKMGTIDRGHRAAFGNSALYSMWRWGTSWSQESKEKNRQADEQQGNDIEVVNQNVRQEILVAYFMKTQLPPYEGETPEQYKARVMPQLQDRLSYIKRFTSGTYDASILGQHFFEQAGDYADLMKLRRAEQARELHYTLGTEEKVLDLNTLDYVGNSGMGDAEQMKFLKTMHQYAQEVKIQKEAVDDLYHMDIPLA